MKRLLMLPGCCLAFSVNNLLAAPQGAFSIIPIQYNEATKIVTVCDRKGGLMACCKKEHSGINLITHGKTKRLNMDTYDNKILYDGKKIEVNL